MPRYVIASEFEYADPLLLNQMLDRLEAMARKKRAIWLKIDPDVIAATGVPGEPDDTEQPLITS